MEQEIKASVKRICESVGIPTLPVTFKTKGEVAGYFEPYKVDFNLQLANSVGFNNFYETIVHEVAHAIDWIRAGKRCRIKNNRRLLHDKVWKDIMAELGFPNAKATHNYKTTKARVYRQFLYNCGCVGGIVVKTPTHNKIQKKYMLYTCSECKTTFSNMDFVKEIPKQ